MNLFKGPQTVSYSICLNFESLCLGLRTVDNCIFVPLKHKAGVERVAFVINSCKTQIIFILFKVQSADVYHTYILYT